MFQIVSKRAMHEWSTGQEKASEVGREAPLSKMSFEMYKIYFGGTVERVRCQHPDNVLFT